MDNWFTSFPVAKSLLKNKIGMVGTLRKNKTCIPPALLVSKGREAHSSTFAHTQDVTLVSYIPKKGKNVILLSTVHHDQKVDPADKKKPEIIKFYNKNKGAVDTVDRRIASYSVKRATKNWRIVVVYNALDLSLNNAFVLYDNVFEGWSKALNRKRIFLERLGSTLVARETARRERIPRNQFSAEIVRTSRAEHRAADGAGPSTQPSTDPNQTKKRKRCSYCEKSYNKHTTTCTRCGNHTCKVHTYTLCPKCKNN